MAGGRRAGWGGRRWRWGWNCWGPRLLGVGGQVEGRFVKVEGSVVRGRGAAAGVGWKGGVTWALTEWVGGRSREREQGPAGRMSACVQTSVSTTDPSEKAGSNFKPMPHGPMQMQHAACHHRAAACQQQGLVAPCCIRNTMPVQPGHTTCAHLPLVRPVVA